MSYKNAVTNDTQELMTIFVETLTGTTFEVKVSPQDRVKSIKYKIQKVEGIPVSHQHLLYNSQELQDSTCVSEPPAALRDRSTVKLVLSMRGGPISLVNQAVPLNRAILKNLLKFNREELLEDVPSGCKMAILVLRVGDQLNLLHIVDDADESGDPSPNSMDKPSTSLGIDNSLCMEENFVTMRKYCDLKDRLEKLSLQRKFLKDDSSKEETSSVKLKKSSFNSSKPVGPLKLPSIVQPIRGETLRTRSEFSQVPILPDIIPQPCSSRDIEYVSLDDDDEEEEGSGEMRPQSCPADSQFYNVLSEQNSLHITQPHFRSCVSACASKLHHEWGGLNILPPISSVPDFQAAAEKLDQRHRKLSSNFTYKQNLRKEPQFSFSGGESILLSRTHDSDTTDQDEASSSHHTPSRSFELFPKLSDDVLTPQAVSTYSSYCDMLIDDTKKEVAEPQQNNDKVRFDKKSRLRCSECRKRLSLTNTFECRCGFTFCSYHRYSETHHCTYDFKKESRKMLEQTFPSIIAPKLPKI